MNIRNEIKSLIAKNAQTLKQVCEEMSINCSTNILPNNISNKLRRNTIKFNEIEQILDILGYHIEFVKNKPKL